MSRNETKAFLDDFFEANLSFFYGLSGLEGKMTDAVSSYSLFSLEIPHASFLNLFLSCNLRRYV